MFKLLIAEPSGAFVKALTDDLSGEFDIQVCQDGETALELLQDFCPDALILNLMLPYKDGITLLQESPYQPPCILGITSFHSLYMEQRALSLGISTLLVTPTPKTVKLRLLDLIHIPTGNDPPSDPYAQTALHLRLLNFSMHLDGYRQLCYGIPLFARDPNQYLTCELYPAIAALCGSKSTASIEHSIRRAITEAWRRRDPVVWSRYFPSAQTHCPCNKTFISCLASYITLP